MKKTFVILLVLLFSTLFAFPASAQVRVDINVNEPLYIGAQIQGLGSTGVSTTNYFIPIPEFDVHYQFNYDQIHIGLGARLFTAIIVSVIYPNAFVEIDLDPIVFNLSLGGGVFGLIIPNNSQIATGPLVLPEISAGVKVNEWFRIMGGFLAFTDFNNFMQNYAYIGFVRFQFTLGTETKKKTD